MAKTKILIIDDSADTRSLVSARLKKHQYDTVFAADALQAITIARQTQPDAIILDFGLPGGHGFIVRDGTAEIDHPAQQYSGDHPDDRRVIRK